MHYQFWIMVLVGLTCSGCHRMISDYDYSKKDEKKRPPKPPTLSELNTLGLDHLQKGRLTKAEACFQRVLKKKPKDAAALLNLAVVATRAGNLKRALRRYQALITAYPVPDATQRSEAARLVRVAYRNSIRLLNWAGEHKRTVAMLKRYAKIANAEELLQIRSYIVSGFPHQLLRFPLVEKKKLFDVNKYSDAVKMLQAALAGVCAEYRWNSLACDRVIRPIKMMFLHYTTRDFTLKQKIGFYQAFNNLAVTRCLLADRIRCERNLRRGLTYYANSVPMLYNLALVQLIHTPFMTTKRSERAKVGKAMHYLQRILVYAKPTPHVRYLIGAIALLLGDKAKAKTQLDAFKDKNHPQAFRLQRWYDSL